MPTKIFLKLFISLKVILKFFLKNYLEVLNHLIRRHKKCFENCPKKCWNLEMALKRIEVMDLYISLQWIFPCVCFNQKFSFFARTALMRSQVSFNCNKSGIVVRQKT